MFWLFLTAWFVQQDASNSSPTAPPAASVSTAGQGDTTEDAWVGEARDWLVACRVAFDKMTPAQTKALTERFEKLSPAALRILMTVYEQTYRVASPLSAADRRPPDATEAEREWIMAYRILYDKLSPEEAKKYGETLKAMSPSQIRALVQVYQEKNRLQAERAAQNGGTSATPTSRPDDQDAARRSLQEAQQRMEFEHQRRQLALGRAGTARKQTSQALASANASSAVTAAAENQRLRDIEQFSNIQTLQHNAFQNRMYERSTPGNPNNNYGFRVSPFY